MATPIPTLDNILNNTVSVTQAVNSLCSTNLIYPMLHQSCMSQRRQTRKHFAQTRLCAKVVSVKCWAAVLFLFVCMLPDCKADCIRVLNASKDAYFGQVDFMRRGMRYDTVLMGFAVYITFLIEQAWMCKPGPFQKFGDICLPESVFQLLQDSNGSLRETVHSAKRVQESRSAIPLLSESELNLNLDFAKKAEMDREIENDTWKTTADYLMEVVPKVINTSRLVFPSPSYIRVEPYRKESCYEFEQKYNISGVATLPANNLTASMISLVRRLLDMGADPDKAMQLLKHNTAYVNMGVRCRGVENAALQVPLYFLNAYARHSAWLSKRNPVSDSTTTLTYILDSGQNLANLLSSYSSGGRLPSEVLSTTGKVYDMTYEWNNIDGFKRSIWKANISFPTSTTVFHEFEEMQNEAISEAISESFPIMNSDLPQLAFSQVVSGHSSSDKMVSSLPRAWTSYFLAVLKKLKMNPFSLARNQLPDLEESIPVTIRNPCGLGWTLVNRTNVSHSLEKCCAPICTTGPNIVSPGLVAQFQESCCSACNQHTLCPDAEADEVESLYIIEIPPCGGNCNSTHINIVI